MHHRHLAGDLTGSGTADAVTDDREEIAVLILHAAVRIFIELTLEPLIARSVIVHPLTPSADA